MYDNLRQLCIHGCDARCFVVMHVSCCSVMSIISSCCNFHAYVVTFMPVHFLMKIKHVSWRLAHDVTVWRCGRRPNDGQLGVGGAVYLSILYADLPFSMSRVTRSTQISIVTCRSVTCIVTRKALVMLTDFARSFSHLSSWSAHLKPHCGETLPLVMVGKWLALTGKNVYRMCEHFIHSGSTRTDEPLLHGDRCGPS